MNRSPLRWRSIHGRCGRSERDPDKAWPATAAQRCAHRHPRVRQRRCPALVTRWLSGSRFSEMTGVPPAGSRLVEARERRLSAPSGQPPTPGIRARSASTPSAAVASFRARSQCAESRLRERARRDGLPGETVVHWPQRTPCVATSFSPIHTAFGGLSPGPEPDGVACCHSVRGDRTNPRGDAEPSIGRARGRQRSWGDERRSASPSRRPGTRLLPDTLDEGGDSIFLRPVGLDRLV